MASAGPRRKARTAARLKLTGDMTIYAAREQRDRMVRAFEAAPSLTVDLSGVVEIDTAGVQLLLALKRDSARLGRRIDLVGHSGAVVAALDRYGLSAVFGDPMVLAPEKAKA
jgi:anti-sigma B factor antagonist